MDSDGHSPPRAAVDVWSSRYLGKARGWERHLAVILKMCVGFRNCSNPSASHIITSQFDEWRVNKLLVVISEIYEDGNWQAYNKLKSLFTEKGKNSNLKYIGSHELDCCTLFLIFSNSLRCMKIDNSDRRLLIPRITEIPWPREKFREFYDWLFNQDGFGCVLDWAHEFETKYGGEYVLEGDDAPMTESKGDLIETCRTPAENKALEMAEELAGSDLARVVPAHTIYGALAAQLDSVDEKAKPHVKDAAMRQFRQAERLHVTANNDRVRFGAMVGGIAGGSDKETAVLNPAALLEIEVLFGVKISHGRWFQNESGKPVGVMDLLRPIEPRSIADYLRGRRVDAWGVILKDIETTQKPQGDSAAKAKHPIGEWPHYSKEFADAWLRTGCGRK